jgi:fatty-acyl-CoA synthase
VFNVGPADTLRDMQDRMPHCTQVSAYGMTEFLGSIAMVETTDPVEVRCETEGRSLPGMEIQIRGPGGEVLGPGERGEIVGRGPQRFDGYYKDPEKTAMAIEPDGWFHTGDLGSLDADGRLRYLGRMKDMLKVGGENVAAIEIESYLCTHPAVSIAQVVGVPDAKYQEVPAAFVELRPGAMATEEDLIEFCRGKIATFKVPRLVRFVTEWPMSATKIQKNRLREDLVAELGTP